MKRLSVTYIKSLVTGMILVLLSACSANNKPQPINIGQDNCAYCKMGIADTRFASEIITQKGKIYKFDSIECMVSFYQDHQNADFDKADLWVHDFLHPKEWVPEKKAKFIKTDKIHTPMGMDLIAVKNDSEIREIKKQLGGNSMKWSRLLQYVKTNMREH